MIIVAVLFFAFLVLVGKAHKDLMQVLLLLMWVSLVLIAVGSFVAALAGRI